MLYKFRYSNVDLEKYMEERKFSANEKRRAAAVLCKEADQIDTEMMELRRALVIAEDDENENTKRTD